MVKLAIRDDDMNYFTKVEDVEKTYDPIKDFPISFAVIPAVTDVSTMGACPDTRGNEIPRYVGDNYELTAWLKDKLKNHQCDVLLHGINHSYKIINGKKYAEMEWRINNDLADEIGKWKKYLSLLLDYDVNCFVAPSNKISKYGILCMERNNMNYSGIVPLGFNRPLTLRNLSNYFKRWYLRFVDRLPYPNVLQYSSHKELNACILQNYDYLVEMFHYCEKVGSPMAINVHYWHLRDFEKERATLFRFVDYAMNHGAVPTTISDLLK